MNFNFTLVKKQTMRAGTIPAGPHGTSNTSTANIAIYWEESTDLLFVAYEGDAQDAGNSLTIMLDPKTGLPLTYSNWKKNYR